MDYNSKYFDLNKVTVPYPGWTKNEFVSAVEILENIDEGTLLKITEKAKLVYQDHKLPRFHGLIDAEQVLVTLLNETPKELILKAIRESTNLPQ